METPVLGPTAYLIFRLALYRLMPKAEIVDVSINGQFFSCVVLFPKKVGPEFQEFLVEGMRACVRENIPIKTFSMLSNVLEGYLKNEKIDVDTRLQNVIEEEKGVLELVEVGKKLCLLQEAEEDNYFTSTASIKWIDIAQFQAIASEKGEILFLIRAASGENAKELTRRKKAISDFCALDVARAPYLSSIQFTHDTSGARYPILTSSSLEDISAIIALLEALPFRFPYFLEENLYFDVTAPISLLQGVHSIWKKVQLPQKKGWKSATHTVPTSDSFAHIFPIFGLFETTMLSLYQEALNFADFQSMIERSLRLYEPSENSSLQICIYLSSKLKNKQREGIFKKIQSIIPSLFHIHIICDTDSSLLQSEGIVLFSSFFFDGLTDPYPRGGTLFSLYEEKGEWHIKNCTFVPFFSYENMCQLQKKSQLSSFFDERISNL